MPQHAKGLDSPGRADTGFVSGRATRSFVADARISSSAVTKLSSTVYVNPRAGMALAPALPMAD